jgi:hypothetical protein
VLICRLCPGVDFLEALGRSKSTWEADSLRACDRVCASAACGCDVYVCVCACVCEREMINNPNRTSIYVECVV